MTFVRYVLGIWFVAAGWTFAAALITASLILGEHPTVGMRWLLLWLHSLPAMLLVASASLFAYHAHRHASTAGQLGIHCTASALSGVLGVLLTQLVR